jgi:hypothetical protein
MLKELINRFYKTPDIGYVWGPNTGQMFFYFTQGVAAAEVEIDTLTGDWTCRRVDLKMDVGRSINPAIGKKLEFPNGHGLHANSSQTTGKSKAPSSKAWASSQ